MSNINFLQLNKTFSHIFIQNEYTSSRYRGNSPQPDSMREALNSSTRQLTTVSFQQKSMSEMWVPDLIHLDDQTWYLIKTKLSANLRGTDAHLHAFYKQIPISFLKESWLRQLPRTATTYKRCTSDACKFQYSCCIQLFSITSYGCPSLWV
jgi:hypothetical protein